MNPNSETPLVYTLRRSERAKNARIVVKPGKIEVVAPLNASERRIKAFVEAQQDWILNAVKRITDKAQAVPSLAPSRYTDGATIPYQGKQFPLRIQTTLARTVRVALQADAGFIVGLPAEADEGRSSELIRQALMRWMKLQARREAHLFIETHAPRFQLYPQSLRIKTQKSRWGSCGPKNDINLNWLLMLAPPEAMEYVVVHELCHIRHKNHSQAFWQLVEEHLPDYQQRRRWLKQHGASVMRGL